MATSNPEDNYNFKQLFDLFVKQMGELNKKISDLNANLNNSDNAFNNFVKNINSVPFLFDPIANQLQSFSAELKKASGGAGIMFDEVHKAGGDWSKAVKELARETFEEVAKLKSTITIPPKTATEPAKANLDDRIEQTLTKIANSIMGTFTKITASIKDAFTRITTPIKEQFSKLASPIATAFDKARKKMLGPMKERDVVATKQSMEFQEKQKKTGVNVISAGMGQIFAQFFKMGSQFMPGRGGGGGNNNNRGGDPFAGGDDNNGPQQVPVFKAGFTPADFQKSLLGMTLVLQGFSAAIKFAMESLLKLAFTAAFFVKALNPALVEQFNYALKDLQAVVGIAFVPLLQAFTALSRFIADVMLPLFRKLQPAFIAIGNALTKFLGPIVMGIANLFTSLADMLNNTFLPAIESAAGKIGALFGKMIEEAAPIIDTVFGALSALASVVGFAADALGHFAWVLTDILGGVVIGGLVVVVGALIAVLWPFVSVTTLIVAGLSALGVMLVRLVRWLMGFENKKTAYEANASQGIAARQASYQSAEDISKNLIKAAFGGAGGDRLKNIDMNGRRQVELLERIADKKGAGAAPNNLRGLAVA